MSVRRLATVAEEGLRTIARRPLRSTLTAVTSAVAIAVTVNVISLVYGLDEDLRRDAGRFGRRTVDVARLPVLLPGRPRTALGPGEVEAVRGLVADLGAVVVPRRLARGEVAGDARVDRIGVVAVPASYAATLDVGLAAGAWWGVGDAPEAVCVLDASVADGLFPGVDAEDVPGRSVVLSTAAGRATRRVVGVLSDPLTNRAVFDAFDEGRGARTLTSALLAFRNVYVPLAALGGGDVSGISVVAPSETDVDTVAARLRRRWPAVDAAGALPATDVGIFVRRDWMDLVGSASEAGAFLGNIVWIIIVGVAAVMISTLNLLTIRERYDELAVRRVEGAGREEIALQVTVEGVALSVVGALAGLPLGHLGAALLRHLVAFPFRFELPYAVAAMFVAILLGLVASVLPARRAASLQPVHVLTRRPT